MNEKNDNRILIKSESTKTTQYKTQTTSMINYPQINKSMTTTTKLPSLLEDKQVVSTSNKVIELDSLISASNIIINSIKVVSKIFNVIKVIGEVASTLNDDYNVIKKLSENQLIYFGELETSLVKEILESNNPGEIVYKYLEQNNFKEVYEVIQKINEYQIINSTLFNESICAYEMGHYHLACIGFTIMIDDILSQISNDHSTKLGYRLSLIKEKLTTNNILNNFEIELLKVGLAINVNIKMHKNYNIRMYNYSS